MLKKIIKVNAVLLLMISALVSSIFLSACNEKENEVKFVNVSFYVDDELYSQQKYNSTEDIALPNPTKEGNTFNGWYDNLDCVGEKNKIDFSLYSNELNLYGYFEKQELSQTISVPLSAGLSTSTTSYNLQYSYNPSYFLQTANVLNKDLTMLSFACATSNYSKNAIQSFFSKANFDDILLSDDYNTTPTINSVAYCFAHLKVGSYDLIAVSPRGFNYGAEWANNACLGKEGNHKGFEDSAITIYDALKGYIQKYDGAKLKLWITGYSRGGAISNVLASNIIESKEINVLSKNMFVYTFEAPKGVVVDKAQEYLNVHNIINSADMVTYVLPRRYSMVRCGSDIDIYAKNVDSLVNSFDGSISIPTFQAYSSIYKTPQEFNEYVLKELITFVNDENISIHSRSKYAENLQDSIMNLLELYYTIPYAVKNEFLSLLKNLNYLEYLNLLNKDVLYKKLETILDDYSVEYDKEVINNSCNTLVTLLSKKSTVAFNIFNNTPNNIERDFSFMHYPEIIYVLLLNYFK